MPGIGFAFCKNQMPPVAVIGRVLPVWTNSYGAVAAVFEDGEKLGLKPGEFEIVEWHNAK
jgi:hypothetical protein